MPTSSSSSAARLRAAALEMPRRCACIALHQLHAHPMGNGCSADRGSWKIIEASLPRTRRSLLSSIATMSSPWNMMRPSILERLLRVSPSMVSEDTVLPEPDSPTIPSVLPASSA